VLRSVPDPKPKDPGTALAETIALLDAVDANLLAVDLEGRCAFVSRSAAQTPGLSITRIDRQGFRALAPSTEEKLGLSGVGAGRTNSLRGLCWAIS